MFQPVNSAIDRYGRLFVLDYHDNTVKLFDTDLETILSSFGGTGSEVGKFNFNAKSYTFPDIILIGGAENSDVADEVVEEVAAENTERAFAFSLPNTDIKLDTLQITDGVDTLTYSNGILKGTDANSGNGTVDTAGVVSITLGEAPTAVIDILASYTHQEADIAVSDSVEGVLSAATRIDSGSIDFVAGTLTLTLDAAPTSLVLTAAYTHTTEVVDEDLDIGANGILTVFADKTLANDNIVASSFVASVNISVDVASEDTLVAGNSVKTDFGSEVTLTNTPVEAGTVAANIDVVVPVAGEDTTVDTENGNLGPYTGTLVNAPILGTVSIVATGKETFTDSVTPGTLVGDNGGTGTVDASGNFSITLFADPTEAVDITADYNYVDTCAITDDGAGNLQADSYLTSGLINYETGAITTLVFTNAPISENLLFSYNYIDVCSFVDDGANGFTEDTTTYIDSGSIAYSTGVIAITFNKPPVNTEAMVVSYSHTTDVTDEEVVVPCDGEAVLFEDIALANDNLVADSFSAAMTVQFYNEEEDVEVATIVGDVGPYAIQLDNTTVVLGSVEIVVGTHETFTDSEVGGTLNGDNYSVGTVDPITGAVTVEFNIAPTSDILATYTYYEEDNLIISDTFNHRIQIVDRSGNSLAVMGEWGTGDEALSEPCGMQLNQAGTELHVVDRGNNRVSVWKLSDNTHVANYGSVGHSEASGLCSPNDIVLGHATNDVMFVTDTGNNRVVSFELGDSWTESDPYVKKTLDDYVKYTVDPSTKLIGITTNTFPVLGIEFDGTSFFLTDLYRSTVAKFNTSWVEQTLAADFGVTAGKVKYPRGLFISGTNLYVADTGSEEIEVISLA